MIHSGGRKHGRRGGSDDSNRLVTGVVVMISGCYGSGTAVVVLLVVVCCCCVASDCAQVAGQDAVDVGAARGRVSTWRRRLAVTLVVQRLEAHQAYLSLQLAVIILATNNSLHVRHRHYSSNIYDFERKWSGFKIVFNALPAGLKHFQYTVRYAYIFAI